MKKKLLAEIKKHEKADTIIKGTYGSTEKNVWKGCAVGCSLKSMNGILKKEAETGDHHRYESELGIPEGLAWLEDRLF